MYDGNTAVTKAAPIVIADTTEFEPTSPKDGKGMKKCKMALVSKSSAVPAAQEVIAPVTFQVVYKYHTPSSAKGIIAAELDREVQLLLMQHQTRHIQVTQ
ncbi:hypothetical protein CE143_18330 [Photorhabdus luminescens]|uniref:Uncharacterized protein n=3 Tax=Morganellaceae TaxID=1903414 RepID=A0A022PK25_9GAMM|nr:MULTISPECIES: hypothetical protein [Photorhabdus]KGM27811.1 hypothetical protein KS18_13110 [Photorhabdus luminescens]EYU16001.1 hypothetical protein BA1DRAFT_01490 [Photorhabdus aegyptia]MBS9427479.1 hypothetical protein [Photorhabdus akhurstii]QXF34899.1 hypothetical protein B0X70_18295 [Photorhabdus akhurstii]UJD76726.1 hypothetical protein CE143_18330 [Photorhabdus luminescens]